MRFFTLGLSLFGLVLSISILSVRASDDADIQTESDGTVAEQQQIGDDFLGAETMDAVLIFNDPDLGPASDSKPVSLPVGKQTKMAVSLVNTGLQDVGPSFVLHSIEAALHYPYHYGYHVQNFTAFRLQNTVEPSQEASVLYSIWPHIDLVVQPFDLVVILNYRDQMGTLFRHSLFNRTVSLHEEIAPMDTEATFRIILEIGVVLLLGIGVYHWFFSSSADNKSASTSSGHASSNQAFQDSHRNNKTSSPVSSDDDLGVPTSKPANEYAALIKRQSSQTSNKGKTANKRDQGRR